MPNSWNDFLSDIRAAKESLGNPKIIWYRGHSDANWNLLPNIFRIPDSSNSLELEKMAFFEFKSIASRLFESRRSDWEILFDMQHYWVPTRLLDWSEVLGIAIAFILHNDYEDIGDSAVFVLDPTRLNNMSGIREIKSLPDDINFEYRSIYWENKPFAARYPIAITPPMQTERIFAQRGVFTIHGDDSSPLEEQCPDTVKKVILRREAKNAAREFLEYANLDEYSIYPDFVGMSRHLRRKVFGY